MSAYHQRPYAPGHFDKGHGLSRRRKVDVFTDQPSGGSFMEWEDILQDFAVRTKANLDHIYSESRDDNAEVYEVTQLVNSLLGLIVFPNECRSEAIFDEVPSVPSENDVQVEFGEGLRIRVRHCGDEAYIEPCKELIRKKMRHATAHFGLESSTDEENQISSLTFHNRNPNNPNDWMVIGPVPIEDLQELTCVLVKDITGVLNC